MNHAVPKALVFDVITCVPVGFELLIRKVAVCFIPPSNSR